MTITKHRRLIVAGIVGAVVFLTLLVISYSPTNLLGRILEGDELLRVQVQSDFDRDGDIDFIDFTFFSAFYEEA